MKGAVQNPSDVGRRFSRADAVLAVLLLAATSWVWLRVGGVLEYRWNWGIVPQYIAFRSEETGQLTANLLARGFATTIRLSIWSAVLALPLGLGVAMLRLSPILYFRQLARTYVELFRNVPPLVLVFIFFFFVSEQILPLLGVEQAARSLSDEGAKRLAFFAAEPRHFPSFVSGVLVLALFESAFVAEIIRAGIVSLERGQWEAADSLGLPRLRRMQYVILPQAIRRVLPALANQFISLVKDSSIISLISIQELTYRTSEMVVVSRAVFEAWLTAAAFYFTLCYSLSLLFRHLEKRGERDPRHTL